MQEALARGQGTLADELTHHLLKAARGGNVVAAIYLTKARLGWVEGQVPDGAPRTAVQVNIQIPRAMSDAEFQRMVAGPRGGFIWPLRSRRGRCGVRTVAPTRFQQAVLRFRGHCNIVNAGGAAPASRSPWCWT